MLRWEENCSWRQSVLGSNPVSGWETLTEPPGISEPRSLLRRRYESLPPNLPCQLRAAAPPSAAALLLRSQETRGAGSAEPAAGPVAAH